MVDKASHSEVEQFVACERRHYYNYGHKIQSRSTSDALARGNVGHLALGTFYQARQRNVDYWDAVDLALDLVAPEMKLYGVFDEDKMTRELLLLLGLYFDEYEDDDMEVLSVEILHDIKLTSEYIMPIKVDLVARIPDRGVVAIDHKFCNDFFNVDKIDLNPQLPKYYAALNELDIHVDGVMYNEIRYRNTIENRNNPSERFRRTPVPLTPKKVVTIMREQMMAARRISQLKELPLVEWESKVLRNHLHCQMCSFTAVCDADANDQDADLIINSFYESKTYR